MPSCSGKSGHTNGHSDGGTAGHFFVPYRVLIIAPDTDNEKLGYAGDGFQNPEIRRPRAGSVKGGVALSTVGPVHQLGPHLVRQ